jgi:hypothetical protein
MTRSYYDDNFGFYEIEDEDDVEFYHRVQEESVEKTCQGCKRKVKLRPDYAYCNSCTDILERGGDLCDE